MGWSGGRCFGCSCRRGGSGAQAARHGSFANTPSGRRPDSSARGRARRPWGNARRARPGPIALGMAGCEDNVLSNDSRHRTRSLFNRGLPPARFGEQCTPQGGNGRWQLLKRPSNQVEAIGFQGQEPAGRVSVHARRGYKGDATLAPKPHKSGVARCGASSAAPRQWAIGNGQWVDAPLELNPL